MFLGGQILKLVISEKIKDDRYSVKFNQKIKNAASYFNRFINVIGRIQNKSFDSSTRSWIIDESGMKMLEAEDLRLFPAKNMNNRYKNIIKSESKDVCDWQDIGKDMKLGLYDYQKKVVKFAVDNHDGYSTLIVSPCGSGKTPMGIAAYIEARKRGIISTPGLIVVKASLKTQWAKEIDKFSDLTPGIIYSYKECVSKIDGIIKRREKKLETAKLDYKDELEAELIQLKQKKESLFDDQFKNKDLLILNYETLKDAEVKKKLHSMKLQFIFADEIHYVKSDEAKRSKALCEFNEATIKIGATATPVQRDPRDIFGIFKFVKPDLFPKKSAFSALYVRFAGFGRVIGAKNEKKLNEKISPSMYILTKEEVSKQLPKLVVSQRYCDFEPKQQAVNDKYMEELEELKEKEKAITLGMTEAEMKSSEEIMKLEAAITSRQTFLQELTLSEELFEHSDSDLAKKFITKSNDNKMDLMADLVSEIIDSGEKVCIFSRFARMQPIIAERIHKELKDVKIAYINGSLNSEQRYEEAYTKFRDDDDYKVLICSDAGAEGLNLSKTKYMIEMDLAVSYAIQTQRHGRLERADSVHDTVFVYQLIMNNSWDEIGLKIVDKKEKYDMSIVKGINFEE